MAQKIEKLTDEQMDKLKGYQDLINEATFNIGRMTIREGIVKQELDRVHEVLKELKNQYDSVNTSYTEYLGELDKIYPNGEVDLKEGTVIYESAE